MKTEEERYEDIAHKCKDCKAKWTVRMRLMGGYPLTLPAYVGSDTYVCPNCKSENTIMFSGREKVEL